MAEKTHLMIKLEGARLGDHTLLCFGPMTVLTSKELGGFFPDDLTGRRIAPTASSLEVACFADKIELTVRGNMHCAIENLLMGRNISWKFTVANRSYPLRIGNVNFVITTKIAEAAPGIEMPQCEGNKENILKRFFRSLHTLLTASR